MLFHLPLAFLPLAAWPGNASVEIPANDIAIAATVPTIAAGMSVTAPGGADIAIAGSPVNLFEGELVVLPGGDVVIATGLPTLAAGSLAYLAQTVQLPVRFGALAETALAAPPVDGGTDYGPRAIELRADAPQFSSGVVDEFEWTFTRTLPAHFGVPAETALAAGPVNAEGITGPGGFQIVGHAAEGFARRRRLTSQINII